MRTVTHLLIAGVGLLMLAGCDTIDTRINQHATEFAALPAAARREIRHGNIKPGFSTNMVYMALGRPSSITAAPDGDVIWDYPRYPVTAYNETIEDGYRRSIVFDPVKRSHDVVVQWIDPKAFPQLLPHTLRLTFHDDHLVSIARIRSP